MEYSFQGQVTPDLSVIERLAASLQKLTTSASAHPGADCMLHALLAQRILQEQGMATRLVVGEAAWRIGPGDGDVITHSPRFGGYAADGVKALPFHAWLECGDSIIDFTTHSLRLKATQLDEFDGGTTNVAWCPQYLVMDRKVTKTVREVTQADSEGVACYREIPELYELVSEGGLLPQPDEGDVDALRIVFRNPDMQVFGPGVH